jgi:signal-transduction protein with cAMP-binding, CBS, and nucleotidyltransferase domain
MPSAPTEVWGDLATTAFVEASVLFRSLDAEGRQDLLKLAHAATWGAGEPISSADDDGLVLVVDGRAVVCGEAGAELATLERGGFFGAHRVLPAAPRAWSLAARTDVTAVVFPAPVVGALAERSPRMKKLLEAVLAAREREASEKLRA